MVCALILRLFIILDCIFQDNNEGRDHYLDEQGPSYQKVLVLTLNLIQ